MNDVTRAEREAWRSTFMPRPSLTDATLRRVRDRFAAWHHEPSSAQWAALRALAEYLESMANGTAPAEFALCDLDPGMGKSQTAAAFIRSLLNDPLYASVGVLVMVSRLEEIHSFVEQIGLRDDEFAAMASKTNAEGVAVRALGMTAPSRPPESRIH